MFSSYCVIQQCTVCGSCRRRRWSTKKHDVTAGGPADSRRPPYKGRSSRGPRQVELGSRLRRKEDFRVAAGAVEVHRALGSQDVQRGRSASALRRSRRLPRQNRLVARSQGTCRSDVADSTPNGQPAGCPVVWCGKFMNLLCLMHDRRTA